MAQITPDTLPDYHFLLVAPNLSAEWFFRAARAYYDRFSPTVISDGELLALLPADATVAVSILTRRDAFETMAVEVARNRQDAYIDALIHDTPREAATTLDARAQANQPFGVPLIPTPVPPTRAPLEPTVGSVVGGGAQSVGPPTATPNASGFVTQTPTSTPSGNFITQTPSPTPPEDDTPPPDGDNNAPLNPTPGPITGG